MFKNENQVYNWFLQKGNIIIQKNVEFGIKLCNRDNPNFRASK